MTLTRAERAALRGVLDYGTAKAAAKALGKSPRTVEQQLARARERLGVETTIEAVRIAYVDR